jgi:SAM-dependent MidA family methyltransferase
MLSNVLRARIISQGPLTVAQFMEAALYDERLGYYARVARRSGAEGDFYTSVDVGPLFGELLAEFAARAFRALRETDPDLEQEWDLVEAGAGDGRLARDLLDALASRHPAAYTGVRLHLVERSAQARRAQAATLGSHAGRLATSGAEVPRTIRGLLYANELLDAMPVHRVRMTEDGLVEYYVQLGGPRFVLREGPPSSPRLAAYFEDCGTSLPVGHVADVSLEAAAWTAQASAALARGYLLLIDYGHEASRLYDTAHADGTLRSYTRHLVDAPPPETPPGDEAPSWLWRPGTRDLTAHVDFTGITRAAEGAGLTRLAFLDQGRFLLSLGFADLLAESVGSSLADVKRRLAARALVLPGGLASTHQALLLGRGAPAIIQFPGSPRPLSGHGPPVTG